MKIVEQLYMFHSEDESLTDFFYTYDVGVSLPTLVKTGVVTGITERGIEYVVQAFDGFLDFLGVEDTGFESLSDFWGNDED